MCIDNRLKVYKQQIEDGLAQCFAAEHLLQARVLDAVRYALLGGGKRLRPILLMEFYRLCGKDPSEARAVACGLEMIHTYSLVHDDLPCMDDDDLRRGRATCHRAFDEATAVLAGDALLNGAFEQMLSCAEAPAAQVLAATAEIARCSGVYGMIGGQGIDLAMQGQQQVDRAALEQMVRLKTGALVEAACVGGCLLAGADVKQQNAARQYAQKLGLAFQIRDDVLDVLGEEAVLGKTIGSDAQMQKTTFVSVYGLAQCQAMVQSLTQEACDALDVFSEPQFLKELAVWLVERDH